MHVMDQTSPGTPLKEGMANGLIYKGVKYLEGKYDRIGNNIDGHLNFTMTEAPCFAGSLHCAN